MKRTVKKSAPPLNPPASPNLEEILRMIADAAYFHALERGFTGNQEQEDWLLAEREISDMLASRTAA